MQGAKAIGVQNQRISLKRERRAMGEGEPAARLSKVFAPSEGGGLNS